MDPSPPTAPDRPPPQPQPPQVVFFLGFQKTGTTAVYDLLNRNAHLLPDVEIRASHKATEDLRRAGVAYAHRPTVAALDRLDRVVADHAARFRAGPAPRLLIGEENLVGRKPYNASGHVLDWCKRAMPMLERAFSGYRAVFYFQTRAPEAWRQSLYAQSVRRTRVTAPYTRWAQGIGPVDWPDWQRQLQSVVVSPVVFHAMEDDLARHGFPGAGLLGLLGLDPALRRDDLDIPAPRNVALSPRQVEWMRWVNATPILRRYAYKIGDRMARAREGTK